MKTILSMMLLVVTMRAGVAIAAGPASPLGSDAWKKLDRTIPVAAEIDRLLEKEIARWGKATAPVCNDADFYRRVSLDITGKLPAPTKLRDFAQDSSPDKRAKLINKLLESEDYSRYWSQYWAEVIAAKVTDRRGLLAYRPFEDWMAEQLKNNTPWNQVARELITAEGEVMPGDKSDGRTFLMLGHLGPDAPVERASEVSRIFLGIQIQCAQCHDHPPMSGSGSSFTNLQPTLPELGTGLCQRATCVLAFVCMADSLANTRCLRRMTLPRVPSCIRSFLMGPKDQKMPATRSEGKPWLLP
jgi:hypothetical protein